MKKILFLFSLLVLFSSCSKDEEDVIKSSTYTINYLTEAYEGMDEKLFIFEYNESGETIFSKSVDVYNGFNQKFTANETTKKIKLMIKIEYLSVKSSFWVQTVYYVKKGGNLDINVDGETITGKYEP